MKIELPQDAKLEALVLSAMMTSINACNECFVKLDESDFFDERNKHIFQAIKAVAGQDGVVIIETVVNNLKEQNIKDFDLNYVTQVQYEGWLGMPYEEFMDKIKDLNHLRKLVFMGKELIFKGCQEEANPDLLIGDINKNINEILGLKNTKTHTWESLTTNFKGEQSFLEHTEWRFSRHKNNLPVYDGVPCGYHLLDKTLGMFQKGGLYYIGARTSMGKTTFLVNMMRNMLNSDKSVGMFSLEMPASTIFAKLLACHVDVPYKRWFYGDLDTEEFQRFEAATKQVEMWKLVLEDQAGLDIAKVKARAYRMKQAYKIDILLVDYLTCIRATQKHNNKHLAVDEVSKELQFLSKDLNIPIVCLAQLNRQATARQSPRPNLADFRESGSIEEDADGCILLHRPDYYDRNDKPGAIEVIVAKNRLMGELKTIQFSCNSSQSDRYYELEEIKILVEEKDYNDRFFRGSNDD